MVSILGSRAPIQTSSSLPVRPVGSMIHIAGLWMVLRSPCRVTAEPGVETILHWYLQGNRIIPQFLRWCEAEFAHPQKALFKFPRLKTKALEHQIKGLKQLHTPWAKQCPVMSSSLYRFRVEPRWTRLRSPANSFLFTGPKCFQCNEANMLLNNLKTKQ